MSINSVLIVGAGSILGSQITKEYLKHSVKAHILVRKGSEQKVEELVKLGAHQVTGDLVTTSLEEFANLLKGIDVIVSTITGDDSVTFDGQLKLLNAAKLSGVKKFIPSYFGSNVEVLDFGDVLALDSKKKLVEELKNQKEVDYVLVNNGVFYHYAFLPGFLFEKDNESVKYFGDLNEKVHLTDTNDVAKFVVQASLNADIKNRSINVAGDIKTLNELIELNFGQNVEKVNLGSAQDLKNQIIGKLQGGLKPEEFLPIIYQQLKWLVISAKARPETVDNELFNVQPLPFEDYIKSLRQ